MTFQPYQNPMTWLKHKNKIRNKHNQLKQCGQQIDDINNGRWSKRDNTKYKLMHSHYEYEHLQQKMGLTSFVTVGYEIMWASI